MVTAGYQHNVGFRRFVHMSAQQQNRRFSVRYDTNPAQSSPTNRRSTMAPQNRTPINSDLQNDAQSTVSNTTESRLRQAKRDEAIRRKFETEFTKKHGRKGGRRGGDVVPLPAHQRLPGTVGALKPTQALTVRNTLSIVEASQLMAAKRADSVLVVDQEEHLAGIFTAKDLAFRVIAEGLDPHRTIVAEIMTPNPFCVTVDAPAQDALQTMVDRHFRHLPVCNSDGDVVGLLDINKCMYEALEKMERAYSSSKKLYEAFEGVERDWNAGPMGMNPAAVMAFVEALRDRMACPDLQSIMDHDSDPAEVGTKTNVREAARLMKDRRVTAVVVMEHNSVAGIFTTKDIVLRVIAAGLNPDNCSVIRVMTPHPDIAPPTMTVIDALRKMHDGRFLNLPVVEEETGHLLAVVDVLRLTHFTLEQMNAVDTGDAAGPTDGQAEGPVWNKFFGYAGHEGDTESQISGSHAAGGHAGSALPEVYPSESASAVGIQETTAVSSHLQPSSPMLSSSKFPFKFRDPRDDTTHRFTYSPSEGIEAFRKVVFSKLNTEPRFEIGICYVDDEGDQVFIAGEDDLLEAVLHARKQGHDKVQLIITNLVTNPPPSNGAVQQPTEREKTAAMDKLTKKSKRRDESPPTPPGLPPEILIGVGVGLGVALVGLLVLMKLK